MRYHYLFTDEGGAILARVAYSFTPLHSNPAEGDELVIDSVIPQDFEIGRREELTLRHHAAMLDLDEAEAEHEGRLDPEPEPGPFTTAQSRGFVRHRIGG